MSTNQKTSAGHDAKRRKFTPRPARSAEERLPTLYRGLTDQVNDGHFQNAIKTCRKILSLDPKSQAAFQTLLFLHLQTDDYTSALDLVNATSKAQDESTLQFERAYCLYRLHREKEALSMLEKGSKGRKELHLEAQIRYRLGEYDQAQHVYDDLLAGCDSSSPEHDDIMTNISATAAHRDFHDHAYHSQLSAPRPAHTADSTLPTHVPAEGELESYVPSLPAGWAKGGSQPSKGTTSTSVPKKQDAKKEPTKKRTHRLPQGAVEGKPFTEDPDRWLPMRQRATFLAAQSKKKGNMTSMGTGITQGSSASAGGGGSGGGGGGKKKKGKK
ncbi:hypothetical protein BD324DRAFT_615041 [Kockovaella imperatae]|uniref:Signal recognition particle subunit SRP72 n=1 Tax=Kockovaella imperatae TaxID=4999 RepID=A0A1Y1UP33_9TREE|nr:hypothetical protein BD324DRAFT_615041 [Kockovaella imperatae]ORX39803.1 hypothetical protein BD324DRAFT_615041 [Kockovaella imperatae]